MSAGTDRMYAVDDAIRLAYPEFGTDRVFATDTTSGIALFVGYDFYQPASYDINGSPVPVIDGRGKATIQIGPLIPSDRDCWHERGHSIEMLARFRNKRGYWQRDSAPAYDPNAFQEQLWQLMGCQGRYRDYMASSGWADRSTEWFAENFAVVNVPGQVSRTNLFGGRAPVYGDSQLIAFYRDLIKGADDLIQVGDIKAVTLNNQGNGGPLTWAFDTTKIQPMKKVAVHATRAGATGSESKGPTFILGFRGVNGNYQYDPNAFGGRLEVDVWIRGDAQANGTAYVQADLSVES